MNAYYRSISNNKKQNNEAFHKSIPTLPKIKNYNPNYGTVGSKAPKALDNKLAEGSS